MISKRQHVGGQLHCDLINTTSLQIVHVPLKEETIRVYVSYRNWSNITVYDTSRPPWMYIRAYLSTDTEVFSIVAANESYSHIKVERSTKVQTDFT